jgi:hypothetical protein
VVEPFRKTKQQKKLYFDVADLLESMSAIIQFERRRALRWQRRYYSKSVFFSSLVRKLGVS